MNRETWNQREKGELSEKKNRNNKPDYEEKYQQ